VPLSTIFHLYHGCQFYWFSLRKHEGEAKAWTSYKKTCTDSLPLKKIEYINILYCRLKQHTVKTSVPRTQIGQTLDDSNWFENPVNFPYIFK
jgi:hypothetical protein